MRAAQLARITPERLEQFNYDADARA